VESEWRKTEQFGRVDFRLFDVATPRYITRPSEWPSEIRWIIESYLEDETKWTANDQKNLGKTSIYASPRFFVAQRGELIAVALGDNGWKYDIAPVIARLVGS